MKASSWVTYTVLRLLAFFVPFAVLMLVNVPWYVSAIVAALFGLAFSYIFLRRPREKVATSIYESRHRDKPLVNADDESEDAAIDDASTTDAAPGAAAAGYGSASLSSQKATSDAARGSEGERQS
ncbi:hypothetical protein ASF62_14430 [Leifsonia sp. Leaf325]|nr:DUF4229 domain-containing protein [Leifsonia sp. Leaf325]KQQ92972.1 hypothetical protein ASF62_14430 [Leifsonia sp. Leaf325]